MEIINIEARTFEAMMERFEAFTRKVESLCRQHKDKALKNWLDNQDVCVIMNISPRTLQTLRDSGKLAYTQIHRKMYYKPLDVEKVINSLKSQ